MDRRTFLKIVAFGAAICAIDHSPLHLVEALTEKESFVREIIKCDIVNDISYARYDIFNGTDQLHVGVAINDVNDIDKYRPEALQLLMKEMTKRNWSLNDLKPLPMPLHCTGNYVPFVIR